MAFYALLAALLFHVSSADEEVTLLQKASIRAIDLANLSSEQQDSPPRYPSGRMPCDGGAVLKTQSMTQADYDAIAQAVTKLGFGPDADCSTPECTADFVGCIVRIVGHDFMDFDPQAGTGGQDACLDFNDPDNGGLSDCMADNERALKKVYGQFCTRISLADFFVVAAEAVMVKSRFAYGTNRRQVDFRSRFQYGRTTSEACPESYHKLPDPEDACDAVKLTFVDRLNLTWNQTAALMGVHTMGRAMPTISGYNGFWSDKFNSAIFNNDYYISMIGKGWIAEQKVGGNPKKNQWLRSDPGANLQQLGKEMMLDTDMCLAYNRGNGTYPRAAVNTCCLWAVKSLLAQGELQYSNDMHCGVAGPQGSRDAQGQICCGTTPSCTNAVYLQGPAGPAIAQFANSEETWLDVFYVAWKVATEKNPSTLTPLK